MIRRLAYLLLGSLVCWILIAIPARRLWGDSALLHSGVAFLLCVIPSALTLFWAGWALRQSPEQQVLMILGGTGVRMVLVGIAAVVLFQFVPGFQGQEAFLIWLLVSYLLTLALETTLVLQGRSQTDSAGTK